MKEGLEVITKGMPDVAAQVIEFAGKELANWLPSTYREELQGLAEVMGVSVGALFFYNLSYDITARCTSTVAQTDSACQEP